MTYTARILVTSEEVQCRCPPTSRNFAPRASALVAGSITDLAGVTRAKYVPLRRLEAFQRAGMGVSPSWSVFCVDSGIAFTPNIGVDGDLRIRIDPAELRLVDDGVAWAPGDLTDQQGSRRRAVHTLAAATASNQPCAQRD